MRFTIRNIMKVMRATSGRMFGRVTAGDGPAEELTPAQVRTLLTVYTTSQVDTLVNAKIGGSTGGTDNRVLRSDGVGGVTLQNSPVTIDDSGNVTGVAAITASGHLTVNGGSAAAMLQTLDTGSLSAASGQGALRITARSPHSQVIELDPRGTDGVGLIAGASRFISGSSFKFRNGANSGDQDITCGAITASGAVKTGLKLFSALPAASASTDCIFTVTDRSGRPLAKSDGTNWYNVFTGAILT